MVEDAHASLAAAPELRAAGPGPGVDALRRAYLDLLRLVVTDLAGVATTSVGALPDGGVMARELRGDGRRLRAAGMDWPLHGLTMVGLRRLEDLQACVERIVADGVPGDVIEAGAWRGGASLLIRATLDALGDGRELVVADSFAGFPSGDADASVAHDFLVAPLDEVREAFARLGLDRGVTFVPGFFETTMAGLAGRSWALVRLDADTYEPTRLALRALYPGLAAGGYLLIDDYGSFEGCRRAVDEFRAEHGISEPLEQVDFTCWRWRRTSSDPIDAGPIASTPVAARPAGEPVHVPTAEELALGEQLAARPPRGRRRWFGR
ncbi:MAG: O-methyltransferase [Solirubrobacteraceae bacterium]|jgi:O-methyltransferase|nr:O-methyltransferase [Solirubrobacteraceae bacterium]